MSLRDRRAHQQTCFSTSANKRSCLRNLFQCAQYCPSPNHHPFPTAQFTPQHSGSPYFFSILRNFAIILDLSVRPYRPPPKLTKQQLTHLLESNCCSTGRRDSPWALRVGFSDQSQFPFTSSGSSASHRDSSVFPQERHKSPQAPSRTRTLSPLVCA